MKASKDKLEALIITQNQTLAALGEQKEATARAEQTLEELMEAKTKQKEWYKE